MLTDTSLPLTVALPTSPGVTVLRWPPGTGKSRKTREGIQQAFQQGALSQVVWAVASTIKEDSLAQEAARHFQELGVTASIVLGINNQKGPRSPRRRGSRYARQFEWGHGPEVKIVSHTHLPLIYDRHDLHARIQGELLVIDEFPMAGLLQEVTLTTSKLNRMKQGSQIATKLATIAVLQQAGLGDSPTASKPASLTRTRTQNFLTGEAFVSAFGGQWTDADWHAFKRAYLDTLRRKEKQHPAAAEWISAFRHDVESGADSYRSGVFWTALYNGMEEVKGGEFYSNCLLPLRSLPPTLVLDAYADLDIYQALFRGQTVQIRSGGDPVPLIVEKAPQLNVDLLKLRGDKEKYLQIAEELLLLADQGKPVAVLGNKAMLRAGHSWQRHLKQAAEGLQVDLNVKQLYHHAGRGKNEFCGHHILAITQAHLPFKHEMGAMAALFPTDKAQREKAHDTLLQAERLQMLSRGRQAQFGTRIIVAEDPQLPPALCELREYAPILQFTPKSRNPRWRDAVRVVAEELLDTLGCVPRSALAAVGLVKLSKDGQLIAHQDALSQTLTKRGVAPDSELASWLTTGQLGRFSGVATAGGNHPEQLAEVLEGLGLRSTGQSYPLPALSHGSTRKIKSSVFVAPGQDEKAALIAAYS